MMLFIENSFQPQPISRRSSRGWGKKLFFLIVIVCTLLILLWPTSKKKEKVVSVEPVIKGDAGERVVGQTGYTVGRIREVTNLPGVEIKGNENLIGVVITIHNLAKDYKSPDLAMIRLVDEDQNTYEPNASLTKAFYVKNKANWLWDKKISPKGKREVVALFSAPKGSSAYSLEAKDFNWSSSGKLMIFLGQIEP